MLGSELILAVRRLTLDGLEAWAQVIERGYEGYVAKDEASVYEQGPTRRWLKVKRVGTVEEDQWQRRIRMTLPLIPERAGQALAKVTAQVEHKSSFPRRSRCGSLLAHAVQHERHTGPASATARHNRQ